MTSEEYRKILKRKKLTVVGAGPVLGISRRQAQRLASGEQPIPAAISKLLQIAVRYRIPAKKLQAIQP